MDCHLFSAVLLTTLSFSCGYTVYQNGFKPVQPSYSTAQSEDTRYKAYSSQPSYPQSPPPPSIPRYAEQASSPPEVQNYPELPTAPMSHNYPVQQTTQYAKPNYPTQPKVQNQNSQYAVENQLLNYPSQSQSQGAPLAPSNQQTPFAGEFGQRKHPRFPGTHQPVNNNQYKQNVGYFGQDENSKNFQPKRFTTVQKNFKPKKYNRPQQYIQPEAQASQVVETHEQPLTTGQQHEGKHYIDFHDSHPKYKYEYGVHDANTGDYKSHEEERDGDTVHGKYELVEPTGARRVVHYTSDKKSGFVAVVHREHITHPSPQKPTANYAKYEQSSGEYQPEYEQSTNHEQHINYEEPNRYYQPTQYIQPSNNVQTTSNYELTNHYQTPVHEEQQESTQQEYIQSQPQQVFSQPNQQYQQYSNYQYSPQYSETSQAHSNQVQGAQYTQ